MALETVTEHEGWEVFESAPGSFAIRKGEQSVGPFKSIEEAKDAINLEESRNLAPDQQ